MRMWPCAWRQQQDSIVSTTAPPPLEAKIKRKAFLSAVVGVATRMSIWGEGRAVRIEAVKQHAAPPGFAMVRKRFVLRIAQNS